jgi:hypothetical protein
MGDDLLANEQISRAFRTKGMQQGGRFARSISEVFGIFELSVDSLR